MNPSRIRPTMIAARRGMLAMALLGLLAVPSAGCYRKVVNSRGIGADSTKLRSSHEQRPLDFITTETRREDRDVRPARERERP